nr:MAG TPA: hypothetical protein [Caudoviricetes sp.]
MLDIKKRICIFAALKFFIHGRSNLSNALHVDFFSPYVNHHSMAAFNPVHRL